MDNLCLVAGLGNPGGEYAQTRHNAGFLVVERLAARWRCGWSTENRFQARVARGQHAGRRVWLCQPLTFMNLSGEAVRRVMDYHQVPLAGLLVVVDDADLPLGELRLRPGGGTGGHHGLESVQAHVGGGEYARLRVGIGRQPAENRQLSGHVLGRFSAAELELADKVFERAACQVECWLAAGINAAMNQFNGPIERPATKEEAE